MFKPGQSILSDMIRNNEAALRCSAVFLKVLSRYFVGTSSALQEVPRAKVGEGYSLLAG